MLCKKTTFSFLAIVSVFLSVALTSQDVFANITVDTEQASFTIGKTYNLTVTKYIPSNSISTAKDLRGKAIDISQPTCSAPRGFPYGTKLRIFTEDNTRSIICVVNNYSNQAEVESASEFSIALTASSAEEIESFGKIKGKVIILSPGNGYNLDFSDPLTYTTAGEVEKPNKMHEKVDLDSVREQFYVKNDIRYINCAIDVEELLEKNNDDASKFNEWDQDKRAEYIIRYLTGVVGFTLEQAAGIVGNLAGESNIRSDCVEANGLVKRATGEDKCCPATGKESCLKFVEAYIDWPNTNTYTGHGFFDAGLGVGQITNDPQRKYIFDVARDTNTSPFDINLQLSGMIGSMINLKGRAFGFNSHIRTFANKVPNVALHEAKTAKEAAFTFLDNALAPALATRCGYGCIGNDKCRKDEKRCPVVNDEVAEKTYNHYIRTRIEPAERYAKIFKGIIPDGPGVNPAELKERYNSGNLKPLKKDSGSLDLIQAMCDPKDDRGDAEKLQEFVQEIAWPLYCSRGKERNENGKECKAGTPKYLYLEYAKCRRGLDSTVTSCNVGGWVGHYASMQHLAQDCGGFVSIAMQESGFDENFGDYGGTLVQEEYLRHSSEWEQIHGCGEVFDLSELRPGDVAVKNLGMKGANGKQCTGGHIFIYTEIEDFETDASSASLLNRYPMAGDELNEAYQYNWYRKINQKGDKDGDVCEECINVPLPKLRDASKTDFKYSDYTTLLPEAQMKAFQKAAQDKKIFQAADGSYGDSCLGFANYICREFYAATHDGRNIANVNTALIDSQIEKTGHANGIGYGTTMMFDKKKPMLAVIKQKIDQGIPLTLMVAHNQGRSRHFVSVVGYKKKKKKLTEADLLIYDVASGQVETMDTVNSRFLFKETRVGKDRLGYRIETR